MPCYLIFYWTTIKHIGPFLIMSEQLFYFYFFAYSTVTIMGRENLNYDSYIKEISKYHWIMCPGNLYTLIDMLTNRCHCSTYKIGESSSNLACNFWKHMTNVFVSLSQIDLIVFVVKLEIIKQWLPICLKGTNNKTCFKLA